MRMFYCRSVDMTSSLTQEQQRAFNIFKQYVSKDFAHLLVTSVHELDNIYVKDTIFFVKDGLDTSDLPKGNWNWNKSRQTVHMSLPNNVDVSFYKLNTRKKRGPTKLKVVRKVWIFDIQLAPVEKVTFFWCEKGDLLELVPVSLDALSFLHDCTTSKVAESFGWGKSS